MNQDIAVNDSLIKFPITGKAVCNVLSEALKEDESCVVTDVETLCTVDCEGLGDLWHRVGSTHQEILTTTNLLAVLIHADQAICLNLYSQRMPTRTLYIEDGILVENTL